MEFLVRTFQRNKSTVPNFCFVLMPFKERFTDRYFSVIKPAVEEQGLVCRRADEIYSDNSIIGDIWDGIQQAEIIIADITEKNPNVLYELGLAHAMWRKTILLTQDLKDIPFDLRQLRIIQYADRVRADDEKLKNDLKPALDAMRKTQMNDPMDMARRELEKNHIYAAKNIRESSYNLSSFLDRTSNLLMITGPNLYGILSNSTYRESLINLVKNGRKVQLFLGDRASLRAFGSVGETDLEKSARFILSMKNDLPKKKRNNFEAFFHAGASTLSATISDPNSSEGIIVFTPRWAVDYNPNERLFCVLEKSKHPDLFSTIYSETTMLTLSSALSVEEIVKDFDENPAQRIL